MSDLVPAEKIESIVGAARHPTEHIARAVSAEAVIYILHPITCLEAVAAGTLKDLTACEVAVAQDQGIDADVWDGAEDQPFLVAIDPEHGDLVPLRAWVGEEARCPS